MSVPGLWKELSCVAEEYSLKQLCFREGFEWNGNRNRRFCIGVDICGWLPEVSAAFRHNHSQAGANPELRTIFYHLAHLLESPITAVFVFDGPLKPDIKRSKQVRKHPHWLSMEAKRLIEAFGFSWYCAPGEAEAELAQLNNLDVIDAVLTSDVDALLFGARMVIRTTEKPDQVLVYRAHKIEDRLGLNNAGMILIALLSGGVRECGIKVATALARCQLGSSDLFHTLDHDSSMSYNKVFPTWIHSLQNELITNGHGFLGHTYAKLSEELPASFPALHIVQLYVHPVVNTGNTVIDMNLSPQFPNLEALVALCKQHFTFGEGIQTLQEKFRTTLWSGLAVQMITAEALKVDIGNQTLQVDTPDRYATLGFPVLSPNPLHIISQRWLGFSDASYLISISGVGINNLVEQFMGHIAPPQPSSSFGKSEAPVDGTVSPIALKTSTAFRIPSAMVRCSFPELVEMYDARKPTNLKGLKGSTRVLDVVKMRTVAGSSSKESKLAAVAPGTSASPSSGY